MAFYRRKLPHWQPEAASIFITWRLFKSLPNSFWQNRDRDPADDGRTFVQIDRVLDQAQSGPTWLNDERIAKIVVDSLHFGERNLSQYELYAYVVMPNHIHVLLSPHVDLRKITKGIKGSTGRRANQVLERTGEHFWQRESFDHWVRNNDSFVRILNYIESNPVKADLVAELQHWPWSSASDTTIQAKRK